MRRSAVVLLVASLAACGSPTQPDPRIAQPLGRPTRLEAIEWNFDARVTSVRVQATWGSMYTTRMDVTNGAIWHSSDDAIMRVPRAGQVESVAPGNATLTITYRDVTVAEEMRVFSGESPLRLLTPSTTTEVSDVIRDTTRPTERGIEGVLVEVLSGHNSGRTSMTDESGWYRFYPPFLCGPVTARASKSGYRERVSSSVMCEDGMPNLSLTPIR